MNQESPCYFVFTKTTKRDTYAIAVFLGLNDGFQRFGSLERMEMKVSPRGMAWATSAQARWVWLKMKQGLPQVLVRDPTYQGNPFWTSGFLSHSEVGLALIHISCKLGGIAKTISPGTFRRATPGNLPEPIPPAAAPQGNVSFCQSGVASATMLGPPQTQNGCP